MWVAVKLLFLCLYIQPKICIDFLCLMEIYYRESMKCHYLDTSHINTPLPVTSTLLIVMDLPE